MDLANY